MLIIEYQNYPKFPLSFENVLVLIAHIQYNFMRRTQFQTQNFESSEFLEHHKLLLILIIHSQTVLPHTTDQIGFMNYLNRPKGLLHREFQQTLTTVKIYAVQRAITAELEQNEMLGNQSPANIQSVHLFPIQIIRRKNFLGMGPFHSQTNFVLRPVNRNRDQHSPPQIGEEHNIGPANLDHLAFFEFLAGPEIDEVVV